MAKNTFSTDKTNLPYAEAARELSPELKNIIRRTLVPMLVKQYIQDVKNSSPDLIGGE